MANELAVNQGMSISVDSVVEQRNRIKEIQSRVMRDGVDFGNVPGCPKPSLFKSGAEKLCSTFMLAIDPVAEDLSTTDERKYRVLVRLVHQTTGIFMGSGIGEASTSEEKYKWRKAVCDEEFEATDPEHRRVKYAKDRDGKVYTTKQVRTNPADLANTVLKMAKKRAQIDAVLAVLAASDFFTQDVEDMPAEYLNQNGAAPAPKQSKPQTAAPAADEEPLSVSGVVEKYFPPKGKGPHSVKIGAEYYKAFYELGASLEELPGQEVTISYHVESRGGYTNNMIDGVSIVGQTDGPPAEDMEPPV